MEQARSAGYDKVNIKTDSKFLKNCADGWIDNWKQNGWRTSSGAPVKNREELERFDRNRSNFRDVRLVMKFSFILNENKFK